MMVVDANLLVYAYDASFEQHGVCRDWLEEALAGSARVGLPWVSLLAFVRLVTNPRVFTHPAPMDTAWSQVRSWLGARAAWVPVPGDDHTQHLERCLATKGLGANDVPDAHLAALSIEHGLRLATTDAGFRRFDGLRWFDPTGGD